MRDLHSMMLKSISKASQAMNQMTILHDSFPSKYMKAGATYFTPNYAAIICRYE